MAPEPMYRKIARDLRAQIHGKNLPAGSPLPTQQELAEQYGVARMTVRQAIAELTHEGLVDSRQGRGLTVRDRRPMIYRPQAEKQPRTSSTMDRFMANRTKEGRQASQTIEVAVEPADEIVAYRLRLDPGDRTAVRKRVRSIDGEPFSINDTYYPYELAKDTEIMEPRDIPRGSNNVLADHGYVETHAIDEIFVRLPSQRTTSPVLRSTTFRFAATFTSSLATDTSSSTSGYTPLSPKARATLRTPTADALRSPRPRSPRR
jgi:DNA-binding GntR family transcriptional regulator